jgi:hypothetical protein
MHNKYCKSPMICKVPKILKYLLADACGFFSFDLERVFHIKSGCSYVFESILFMSFSNISHVSRNIGFKCIAFTCSQFYALLTLESWVTLTLKFARNACLLQMKNDSNFFVFSIVILSTIFAF